MLDPSATVRLADRPLFPLILIPKLEQWSRESIGTILGKEQPTVSNFHYAPCAGDRVPEPVGPLLVKEDILQPPHDERRNLQRLEGGMNGDGVRIVEA